MSTIGTPSVYGEAINAIEVIERAAPYYDRISLADAVTIAKEQIHEWDYASDPHGYCHERPVLVALVRALDPTLVVRRVA